MTLRTRCPAKVNLSLAVGRKDSTGYHPIESTFQAVSLFDELTVTPAEVDLVSCSWYGLPTENTLTKTVRLVRELLDLPPLHVQLKKHIPDQSGLGGGSSDAAGLLRCLLKMPNLGLTRQFAHEVAVAVGADVPFFLVGGRAHASGYGEKLAPEPDGPTRWFVISRPDVDVPTAAAYGALDEMERPIGPAQEWENDFELVAPEECLKLKARFLELGAIGAVLSGSGSAVFAEFPVELIAEVAAGRLSDDAQVFVVRTLTREESLWTS